MRASYICEQFIKIFSFSFLSKTPDSISCQSSHLLKENQWVIEQAIITQARRFPLFSSGSSAHPQPVSVPCH